MATTQSRRWCSAREPAATDKTRRWKNRQEVTVGDRFRRWIRCECAFIYMNAVSGRNLSGRLPSVRPTRMRRPTSTAASRRSAALQDGTGMDLGRERPPRDRAWGEDGGSEVGVAHAPDTWLTAVVSRADGNPGGTKRRPIPGSEVAQCEGHDRRGVARIAFGGPYCESVDAGRCGGTVLPNFGSPTLFPLLSSNGG
jgi:hypothetical protein